MPHFLTYWILITQDHTRLSVGSEFWRGETFLAHKNKITQVSSWNQDSNLVTTAYKTRLHNIMCPTVAYFHYYKCYLKPKKYCLINTKVTRRGTILIEMPHNNHNVNMLIKYNIVKMIFQSTLSKYFNLWLWLRNIFLIYDRNHDC